MHDTDSYESYESYEFASDITLLIKLLIFVAMIIVVKRLLNGYAMDNNKNESVITNIQNQYPFID